MARHRNANWSLPEGTCSYDAAQLAVLMDIRESLQRIESALRPLRHLECGEFLAIPKTLRQIRAHTAKPRRKRVKTEPGRRNGASAGVSTGAHQSREV